MEERVDFREFIEKVLSRVDIVNVVSRYLPLKRKGKTYWATCPFHSEKDASFSVTADKQFFHCFGCKESGNAISFIQKIESIDFMDALKIVSEMAGLEVPSFKRNDNYKETITKEKKDRLLTLLREAARHYNVNLDKPEAKSALEYMTKRGFERRILRKFGVGYSMGGEEMITYLESLGYTKAEIKEAGIAEIKGDRYYDVFYNRIIIPIINNFGEVIGFGGRLVDLSSHIPVKYRNTSETPVFDKSKVVFGINLLKNKKKAGGQIKYVIMTEGYMDVMALHQEGFDTAVASMGTALTQSQAKAIKNYTNNVFICYDGDTAGQKATMRGLDILQDCGLNVKVISLPDGLDPDEVIKQKGVEAYKNCIRTALTLTAFKIKVLASEHDLNTPDGKSAFAIEAMKVLKKLENPIEREEYLKNVHEYTGYSMDVLRAQIGISEKPKQEQVPLRQQKQEQTEEFNEAQLCVIASFVYAKPYAKPTDDVFDHLTSDTLRSLYSIAIDKMKEGGQINPTALLTTEGSKVEKVIRYEFVVNNEEAYYKNCLKTIQTDSLKKEKARLSSEYLATKDATILKQMKRIDDKLVALKKGGLDD